MESFGNADYENDTNALFNIAEQSFRIKLLAQYMASDNHVYQTSIPHRKELAALEMDTDNSAVQDLILAAENVQGLKDADMPTLWKFTSANKAVFPEGRRSFNLQRVARLQLSGNLSMAMKAGMPIHGFGLSSSNELRSRQHEP